jgi:hypothetical protein
VAPAAFLAVSLPGEGRRVGHEGVAEAPPMERLFCRRDDVTDAGKRFGREASRDVRLLAS